jgi:hypothetical protein
MQGKDLDSEAKKIAPKIGALNERLTATDTITEVCWRQALFRGFGRLAYAGKAAPSRCTPKEIEWNL